MNKTEMQKILYLVDAVAILYHASKPAGGHITYNHGPYDLSIQRALEVMLFRGLAQVASIEQTSGGMRVRYRASDAGRSLAGTLATDARFKPRLTATAKVIERVDSLGWERIVSLVYAEPTYFSAKRSGRGHALDVSDAIAPSAARLFRLFAASTLSTADGISADLQVDMFFKFLDRSSQR